MKFIKLFKSLSILFLIYVSFCLLSCKNQKQETFSNSENTLSSENISNKNTQSENTLSKTEKKESIENGKILKDINTIPQKINPASFYDSDGTLVKNVYITSNTKANLLDGSITLLDKGQMLKLIAFSGETALVLLPVQLWKDSNPVYGKVSANNITTIYPYFSLYEKNYDEINEYLSEGTWVGKIYKSYGNQSFEIYGEMSFCPYEKYEKKFSFKSDYYDWSGDYKIHINKEYNNDYFSVDNELEWSNLFLEIEIPYYDIETTYEKYQYPITIGEENYLELYSSENYITGEFHRNYSFPTIQEIENFDLYDKKIYNNHIYVELIKNFLENLDDSLRTRYSNHFVKFGIYIDTDEYKQIYNDYWDDIVYKNETSAFPYYNKTYDLFYPEDNTSYNFYKRYVSEIEKQYPKQKTYEETMEDFDTLSKFYYKDRELYPYCHIFRYDEESDENIDRKVYSKPTEKSECVYTYNTSYFAKVTGIGPKDTINGVTSHWVEIVLPRFTWKSMYPEYGWIFGAYVSSPYTDYNDEDFFCYCSNSFIEAKSVPWYYTYDEINVSDYRYDSLFYNPELYDVNENYQTSYYRYLVFNQDERLPPLYYKNSFIIDDLEMEFIRSGVYANIRNAKDRIPEKLYLEEIYNHKIQNARSLYPVFIENADNLTKKDDDPIISTKNGIIEITLADQKSNSITCYYPEEYEIDYINKYNNSIHNKCTLYKTEDGHTYLMIYHSYRDSIYLIHDAVSLLQLSPENIVTTIDTWVSNTFDILSETKASVVFEDNEPILVVQKLNGTLRSKEEYNL